MPEEKRSFVELLPDNISVKAISDIKLFVGSEDGIKKIPGRISNPIKWGMGFHILVDKKPGVERWGIIASPHVDQDKTTVLHFSRTLGTTAPRWARGEYKGSVIVLNGGKGPITVVILKHPQAGR